MIRNFILIAVRNFQRQRLFALLNMFGLALGLSSAILIFLYVSDELRYDSMHPYYDNTYRIGCTWTNSDGRVFDNEVSPGFWVKQLKDTRSDVLQGVRIDYIGYPTSLHDKSTDKIILTESIKWAEPHFDDVFDFKLVNGNQQRMFDNHNSIVLSETGAQKMFGNVDPMGQTITVKHRWATNDREIDVVVTGVYKDLPANSHFKPQFILNVNALRAIHESFDIYMEGTSFSREHQLEFFENYLVVKPGADLSKIKDDLNAMADHLTRSDSSAQAQGWKLSATMTPLSDLHFDQKIIWEYGSQGDKNYLAIFSAVAILILVIACINYMNLATARSARRAKEVGLRKSLGSARGQIAKQFFYESFMMTLGSLIIGFGLVVLLLEPFNQLAHKSFTISSLFDPIMIGIVAFVALFMAFISGSYPAIYLSGFKPVEVLKGQVAHGVGAELFRKSLVTIQYMVALVLIISTFIIIRQMQHLQDTKLNKQGSQLLSIRYGGIAPQNKYAAFKQAVLQDPDIEHVTMGNHLPRLNYFGYIGARVKFPELHDDVLDWNQLNVDFDFPKTYQLELIAGRDFDASIVTDSSSILLNEAAVKALNQPIDKIIGSSVENVFDSARTLRVIGVVKDFPYRSMHQAIEPLILNPQIHFIDRIVYIKLPAGKFQEKIASIEKKWRDIMPDVGFDYWFVSDEFNRMYKVETTVSSLSKTFALLAIVITALGVFGLASYTAEQKKKEVGIRKVMGAEVPQVVGMFLWLFMKILLIASVVALPLAWFLADRWLEGFAYRSPINPLIFIVSLVGLSLITALTVSYETWKAAKANPVVSLRSE